MADISEKVKSQARKAPGLIAPGDEPQVVGPRPVLDNRWGSALAKGTRSPSITGKKR